MIKFILIIGILWATGFSQSITDSGGNNGRGGSKTRPYNVPNQEIQLSKMDAQIQKLQREQKNLQTRLNSRIRQADSLKAAGTSEDMRAKFSAASFVISKKLEALSRSVQSAETRRNALRAQLYHIYTQQIDSLSQLNKSGQADKELFLLMGKRLQVSPFASKLHFNPQQLSAISESENDSLSYIIFREYLEKAGSELATEIKILREKEEEIAEIAALESKAEEFMQEMEESGMLKSVATTDAKSMELGTDYSGNTANARNLVTANEQALSFFRILNQLQNNPSPLSVDAQPLTYSQLLEKLKAARQLLEAYRQQVSDKLKRFTDK